MTVPTLRAHQFGASVSASTTVSVARDVATQVGDSVLVILGTNNPGDITPPDSTWITVGRSSAGSNSTNISLQAFLKLATASGGATNYTFTLPGARNWTYDAYVLSRVKGGANVLVATAGLSNDSAPAVLTIASAPIDNLDFTAFGVGGGTRGSTYTSTAGSWVKQTDIDAGNTGTSTASHHLLVATQVQPSTGATPTGTFTRSSGGAAGQFARLTISLGALVTAPPTANAGTDQTVAANSTATLHGSGTPDTGAAIIGYQWSQVSGPAVTLSSATAQNPTFTAPSSGGTCVFALVVTDDQGISSAPDQVTVVVTPPPAFAKVRVAGAWQTRYMKVHAGGA